MFTEFLCTRENASESNKTRGTGWTRKQSSKSELSSVGRGTRATVTALCVSVTSIPSRVFSLEIWHRTRDGEPESAQKALGTETDARTASSQEAFCVGTEPSGLTEACQRARKRLPRRGEGTPNTTPLPLYSAWGFVCFVLPFTRWSRPVLLSGWAMALYAGEIRRGRFLQTSGSSQCVRVFIPVTLVGGGGESDEHQALLTGYSII